MLERDHQAVERVTFGFAGDSRRGHLKVWQVGWVRDLLLHGIGESSADDAKEKREANDRIEKLEATTRPKPFDERLRMFLNRKDTNILIGLRNGANRFAGSFSQSEPGELKTLMDKPEAAKFIKVKFDGVATLHSSGIMSGAYFELSTELIS